MTPILSTKVTPGFVPLESVPVKVKIPLVLSTLWWKLCSVFITQSAAPHFSSELWGENSMNTSHECAVLILELEFDLRLVSVCSSQENMLREYELTHWFTNLCYSTRLLPFNFLFNSHSLGRSMKRQFSLWKIYMVFMKSLQDFKKYSIYHCFCTFWLIVTFFWHLTALN